MENSGNAPIKNTDGVKEDFKAVEAASSAQGSGEGWGSRLKNILPPEYRNELVQLFKLAGPVVRL